MYGGNTQPGHHNVGLPWPRGISGYGGTSPANKRPRHETIKVGVAAHCPATHEWTTRRTHATRTTLQDRELVAHLHRSHSRHHGIAPQKNRGWWMAHASPSRHGLPKPSRPPNALHRHRMALPLADTSTNLSTPKSPAPDFDDTSRQTPQSIERHETTAQTRPTPPTRCFHGLRAQGLRISLAQTPLHARGVSSTIRAALQGARATRERERQSLHVLGGPLDLSICGRPCVLMLPSGGCNGQVWVFWPDSESLSSTSGRSFHRCAMRLELCIAAVFLHLASWPAASMFVALLYI